MENKLDKEFKDKWIAALRSGEYLQAKESLRGHAFDKNEDMIPDKWGYCCLGVAAHMQGLDMEEFGSCGMLDEINTTYTQELGIPSLLCKPYKEKIANTYVETIAGKLAEMNDSGKSFIEISNWIEKNL